MSETQMSTLVEHRFQIKDSTTEAVILLEKTDNEKLSIYFHVSCDGTQRDVAFHLSDVERIELLLNFEQMVKFLRFKLED